MEPLSQAGGESTCVIQHRPFCLLAIDWSSFGVPCACVIIASQSGRLRPTFDEVRAPQK